MFGVWDIIQIRVVVSGQEVAWRLGVQGFGMETEKQRGFTFESRFGRMVSLVVDHKVNQCSAMITAIDGNNKYKYKWNEGNEAHEEYEHICGHAYQVWMEVELRKRRVTESDGD